MKNNVRNLCIIAHIDHGKSTLADRLMLQTGTITQREFQAQMLDSMDLERERGITIKAAAVRMSYKAKDGQEYTLNLIDTPGHVDFSYEVAKSLRACEGALLVVDAAQGIEAQTVANFFQAFELDLEIIPVLNKVDLPTAQVEKVKEELKSSLGVEEEPIMVSAKSGLGVEELLEAIVEQIPPPQVEAEGSTQALVFDSMFNPYKGVIVYVRLMHGEIKPGDKIVFMSTDRAHEVQEVGVFTPKMQKEKALSAGQVGYIVCSIKDPREVTAGDTITLANQPAPEPLPGYRPSQSLVFSGLYPIESTDFEILRDAIPKLQLTDASFEAALEKSSSFGMGFRCGFLGLLHMEIVQERLEREYGLNLLATTPSVIYQVHLNSGKMVKVDNPSKFPDPGQIVKVEEPAIRAFIIVPSDAIGAVMQLAMSRRGIYKSTEYLGTERAMLTYEFPLSEILVDFNDKLKSATKGYGSMDYEIIEYREADLVKLDILLNGEPCEPLACIVPKEQAPIKGRDLAQQLKELIPRQMFQIAIQAAIGAKIVARETVSAMRKNVTEKCYGGDITRKRKLLEKQKEGKKRMKSFGKVEIPQEAFMAILKI